MEEYSLEALLSKDMIQSQIDENPFKKMNVIICQLLENAILHNDIPTDSKLSPVRIAELLGVSRSPVNDAFEMLLDEGLLTTYPNRKGYYVSRPSYDTLRNFYEARRTIECAVAGLCAQRNYNLPLNKLKKLAVQYSQAIENCDFEHVAQIDQEFHKLLLRSCGNPLMDQMWLPLQKLGRYISVRSTDYFSLAKDLTEYRELAGQHLAIYHAISMGLPQMAADAMATHIDYARDMTLRSAFQLLRSSEDTSLPELQL